MANVSCTYFFQSFGVNVWKTIALKDCLRCGPRDWRSHGHAFELSVHFSFSKSTKLSLATDSGVPTNKSLIVSRAKSSGILVNSETTLKETKHSFGLTVIFFIVSKNCAELSIEYGELAVRGLRRFL